MSRKKKNPNLWKPKRRGGLLAVLGGCVLLAALTLGVMFLLSDELAGRPSDVVISEVMTANAAAWPTEDGRFYDWLELWNRSDHSVELGGYRLSDAPDIRGAYILPEMELAAGERALFFCTAEQDENVLRTNFLMNKDGVSLALFDEKGGVLDAVKVPALRKGEVYARDEEGDGWSVTRDFTPGMENTAAAHRRLRIRPEESGPIRINELMASNYSSAADEDGDSSDWIELYNEGAESVPLAGWSLAEGAEAGGQIWEFPDVSIGPGEYLLVYASGKNRLEGELHAGFKLSAEGETLYLLDADERIASAVTFERMGRDVALARTGDGSFTTAYAPSPGRANGRDTGEVAAAVPLSQNDAGVYVNEVVCSMCGGADWAELYNAGGAAVDLSGWWLSDDPADPRGWAIPEGTGIAPGGYLLFVLGGDGATSAQKKFPCADFSLGLDGEALVLSRPDGTAVDSVALDNQRRNVSYGRSEARGTYRYFPEMTPGAANPDTSYGAVTAEVEVSPSGGRMDGPVTVEMKAQNGAAIYYTTDGSEPDRSAKRYEGPIELSSNAVLRAAALAEDALPSETVNNTYVFDEISDFRLVCVSGEPSSLSRRNGVLNTGSKKKLTVGVEIYEADGERMIDQNCELRVSGHYTTKDLYPQKAFRLKAERQYGEPKFQARLFNGRDYEEYEAIVIRASGQDSREAFMRDALLTSLAVDTEVFYQEYEMCIAYVNGEYWGLYYMREHIDEDSLCQFEGWDPDAASIDILEDTKMNRTQGSSETYWDMMRFVRSQGLASDENVEKLRQWCDIENYLDYVALEIYTEQEDLGNVRAYRNANGDGLWRWVVADLDLSFINDKNNVSMWLSDGNGIGSITKQDNTLFRELMRNEKMRDYFLTRFGELLATTFSAERVGPMIENQYNLISEEMKRTTKRWEWKYETWQKRARTMYNYAMSRPAKLLDYLQRGFHLSDEQMQHYFGETIAASKK